MNDATMTSTRQACPTCGNQLVHERDQLRCPEHGNFFRYGPRLLVSLKQSALPRRLLPWQTLEERRSGGD